MHPHGHSHSHGACAHEAGDHDHGHEDEHGNNAHDNSAVEGEEWSLYQHINTSHLACLNAVDEAKVHAVFKPWDRRLDVSDGFLESDADEQLIVHVPFTCGVNIRSFCVIGHGRAESPASVKMFVNRSDIDFDNAGDVTPTQAVDLVDNAQGRVEYPTKYTKFQGVTELTLFFDTNFGADTTRILYIGFKGVATKHKREAVVANYEIRPVPKANKMAQSNHSYIS